jgi:hypothetical protein
MIYSIKFYPSSFIWSVKITLLFHNMSGRVLHLTAAVVYKVYNLLLSLKGKKYITTILSIVLCRGDPHTLNITEMRTGIVWRRNVQKDTSLDKDKTPDDTHITFRTKDLRRCSGRHLAWIAGSIPVGDIEVFSFECCVLSGRVSTRTRSFFQRSPTECVCVCVCVLLSVIRYKIILYTHNK